MMEQIQALLDQTNSLFKDIETKRQNSKERFNFFQAIVSGKHEKYHIEKYHSNFISYLLNPQAHHDFGDLFLNYFFEELKDSYDIKEIPVGKTFAMQRERPTDAGRLIDISLECGREWIIFIENKIYFDELENQIPDYWKFAQKFDNRIGIYLTLDGRHSSSNEPSIINMSYHVIIKWLKRCCNDNQVEKHSHIVSLLKQYISIIEKLLQVMNEDKRELLNLITKNTTNIDAAERILGTLTFDDLTDNIFSKLIEDIKKVAVQLGFSQLIIDTDAGSLGTHDTGFYFFKNGWKNCIYFYFEGDKETLWCSIDHLDANKKSYPVDVEEVALYAQSSWGELLKNLPSEIIRFCEIKLRRMKDLGMIQG